MGASCWPRMCYWSGSYGVEGWARWQRASHRFGVDADGSGVVADDVLVVAAELFAPFAQPASLKSSPPTMAPSEEAPSPGRSSTYFSI